MGNAFQTVADASHSEDEVGGCCPFFTKRKPTKASRQSLPARTWGLRPVIGDQLNLDPHIPETPPFNGTKYDIKTVASEVSMNPIMTPVTSLIESMDSQDSGQKAEERISPIAEGARRQDLERRTKSELHPPTSLGRCQLRPVTFKFLQNF
jgi:hypothetical protein